MIDYCSAQAWHETRCRPSIPRDHASEQASEFILNSFSDHYSDQQAPKPVRLRLLDARAMSLMSFEFVSMRKATSSLPIRTASQEGFDAQTHSSALRFVVITAFRSSVQHVTRACVNLPRSVCCSATGVSL